METNAGGDVEFKIGVVHAMQPPQGGHRMENNMLKVDGKVEEQYRKRNGEPPAQAEKIEQAPALALRQHGEPDRRGGKQDPYDKRVDQHDAEIGRPAYPAPDALAPARLQQLP